jgi:hypothetical protein
LPYRNSRHLAGEDSRLPAIGVALDVVGIDVDDALRDAWRARVERVCVALGWTVVAPQAQVHACGVTLAFAAPPDQLRAACAANEWALCAALLERDPGHWSSLSELVGRTTPAVEPGSACPSGAIDEAGILLRFSALTWIEGRQD